MKRLVFILPIFLSGCFYINNGVGLTTFEYDKCREYYDGNGKYHNECPKSAIDKGGELLESGSEKVGKVASCVAKKSKEFFYSFGKKECKDRVDSAK